MRRGQNFPTLIAKVGSVSLVSFFYANRVNLVRRFYFGSNPKMPNISGSETLGHQLHQSTSVFSLTRMYM